MAQIPSYTPPIVPIVTAPPWPAPTSEHTAEVARRNSGRQSAESTKTQHPPLNAWILYRWRFISTSDILGDWPSLAGITSQFNHLSIAHHLATAESSATALARDSLLCAHIEALARSRAELNPGIPDFAPDFASLLSNEQPRFKLQAAAQTAKTAPLRNIPHKEKATGAIRPRKRDGFRRRSTRSIWLMIGPVKHLNAHLRRNGRINGVVRFSASPLPSGRLAPKLRMSAIEDARNTAPAPFCGKRYGGRQLI